MEQKKNEIKIELSPDVAGGHYANLAVIAHSPNEFFLDFIAVAPNMPQAKVVTRVIMTPENVKNLVKALTENVVRYEQNFGAITPKQPKNGAPQGGIPNPFLSGGKA